MKHGMEKDMEQDIKDDKYERKQSCSIRGRG